MTCKSALVLTFLLCCNVPTLYARPNGTCSSSHSCTLESISLEGEAIDCDGYFACASSVLLEIASGSSNISCSGGFSCYQSEEIKIASSATGDIRCFGAYSCAGAKIVVEGTDSKLFCYGEQSCANATIVVGGDSIHCHGLRSCAFANITFTTESSSTSEFSGVLALEGANILALEEMNFNFYAHDALRHTTLTCDVKCYYSCGHTSACKDLNVIGDKTRYGYDSWVQDLVPKMYEFDFSSLSNSQAWCSDDSALSCTDLSDPTCYGSDNLQTDLSIGPICCLATTSCQNAANISAFIDSPANDSIAFRADAYKSAADISGTLKAPGGGHMFFAGAYSGYDSERAAKVVLNPGFDVFVTGMQGLYGFETVTARNVYCMAVESCKGSTLRDIEGTLYAYGRRALENVQIYGHINNIYLDGHGSGDFLIIHDSFGDITCTGVGCLFTVDVRNSKGSIYANGVGSCRYSTFVNISTVECRGQFGAEGAQISGVKYLHLQGYHSARDANITSDLHGGFFTFIHGDQQNNNHNVYCSEEDTCKIDCTSTDDGCSNMILHCYGTCLVYCNGDKCPQYINGSVYVPFTSSAPTGTPSSSPSGFPSIEPTATPAFEPTVIPSFEPTLPTSQPTTCIQHGCICTDLPTAMPTIGPSDLPTIMPSHTILDSIEPSLDPSTFRTVIPSQVNKLTNQSDQETTDSASIEIEASVDSPVTGSTDVSCDCEADDFLDWKFIVMLGLLVVAVCIIFVCGFYLRQSRKQLKDAQSRQNTAKHAMDFYNHAPSNVDEQVRVPNGNLSQMGEKQRSQASDQMTIEYILEGKHQKPTAGGQESIEIVDEDDKGAEELYDTFDKVTAGEAATETVEKDEPEPIDGDDITSV